jgi:hypothetical protein
MPSVDVHPALMLSKDGISANAGCKAVNIVSIANAVKPEDVNIENPLLTIGEPS